MEKLLVVCLGLAAVTALPSDVILRKSASEPRYQYMQAGDSLHLVDTWTTLNTLAKAVRFDPDWQNVYHLFTRRNPSISQPFVLGNENLVRNSNFNPAQRTILIIHGWFSTSEGMLTNLLVPAFLNAEDVNVLVMDWGEGAKEQDYLIAMVNTVAAGESAGRFANWLNTLTGSTAGQYHLVGFSLGAHLAGVMGRNMVGEVSYITGLDPAGPGWEENEHKMAQTDAAYVEIIHTMAGIQGYRAPLGHVSFYPNGGLNQPGCPIPFICDHFRAFELFNESIRTGGFTARRCETYTHALEGDCDLPETLQMGGLQPKTGATGSYWLATNGASPFSIG